MSLRGPTPATRAGHRWEEASSPCSKTTETSRAAVSGGEALCQRPPGRADRASSAAGQLEEAALDRLAWLVRSRLRSASVSWSQTASRCSSVVTPATVTGWREPSSSSAASRSVSAFISPPMSTASPTSQSQKMRMATPAKLP